MVFHLCEKHAKNNENLCSICQRFFSKLLLVPFFLFTVYIKLLSTGVVCLVPLPRRLCFHPCYFVYLFVNRFTQKLLDQFHKIQ